MIDRPVVFEEPPDIGLVSDVDPADRSAGDGDVRAPRGQKLGDGPAASAHMRAWSDYDSDTGHNQTVLGIAAHTLLADRQDRVFRLEKYTATDEGQDRDVLLAGLLPTEQESLPAAAGVERADLNNSPAWLYRQYRWFLASFEYGKVHDIAWSRKSATKRKIAAQAGADNPEQFILPGTYDEPITLSLDPVTVRQLQEAHVHNAVIDLVLAHRVNPYSGATELFLGRPRLNVGGGKPWIWVRSSLAGDGGIGSDVRPETSEPTGPTRNAEEPDAPRFSCAAHRRSGAMRAVPRPLSAASPPSAARLADAARLFSGRRLTLARQVAGLRKNGLAERIGKTPTAVASYENGTKRPASATVAQLALTLKVAPSFFIGVDLPNTPIPVHNRVGTRRSTGSWNPAAVRKAAENF